MDKECPAWCYRFAEDLLDLYLDLEDGAMYRTRAGKGLVMNDHSRIVVRWIIEKFQDAIKEEYGRAI